MPTELEEGKKLEFDEEVYDIGPGKTLHSGCSASTKMQCNRELLQGALTNTLKWMSMPLIAGSQGDFDSPVLRLSYTSLTTPSTTMDHNLATHNRCWCLFLALWYMLCWYNICTHHVSISRQAVTPANMP